MKLMARSEWNAFKPPTNIEHEVLVVSRHFLSDLNDRGEIRRNVPRIQLTCIALLEYANIEIAFHRHAAFCPIETAVVGCPGLQSSMARR